MFDLRALVENIYSLSIDLSTAPSYPSVIKEFISVLTCASSLASTVSTRVAGALGSAGSSDYI